jgi:hypothetical protein
MHNFKYHTVEELEQLIEQLKNEIAAYKPYVQGDDFKKKLLEESEDMLRHAEYEVVERTLLK